MHKHKHDANDRWGIPPDSEASPTNPSGPKRGGGGGSLVGLLLLGLLVAAASGPSTSTHAVNPGRHCGKDSRPGRCSVKTQPIPVQQDNSELWCGFALGVLAVALAVAVFVVLRHIAPPVSGVFWADAPQAEELERRPHANGKAPQ